MNAILSKGYFPKELPPVFTTTTFGEQFSGIISDWLKDNIYTKSKVSRKLHGCSIRSNYAYKLKDTEPEIISKPKRGYERRNISITHPIPQALLAAEIGFSWNTVQKWLLKTTYSLDEPIISNKYERSIKGINFRLHSAKKNYIETTSDWLVKTDITRFYPSIYTHSIPWAAYGKHAVKKCRAAYEGSLADRIDMLVRSCNRNQTVGIPIGPETSRIIAEIISSRIDDDFFKLSQKISSKKIDRLQDDWFIGVETLEQAEGILSKIGSVYREYGLEINGSKTSIEYIFGRSGSVWVSELNSFLSHGSRDLRGNRLKEFLSLSLRVQADFPNDSVINYSLSVIEGKKISLNDVDAIESFLMKGAVQSPVSMDKICRIILNIQSNTNKISLKRIKDRFSVLAERNLEKGNLYETIWLVYTLRGLHVSLVSKRISEMIESATGSVLPLILLDMKSHNCFPCKLPTDRWENDINEERIKSDWLWLLAYEGIRNGWLVDKAGVMNKPFFRAMECRRVVFYDPGKNIKKSEVIVSRRRSYQQYQSKVLQRFMLELRGFNVEEDYTEY